MAQKKKNPIYVKSKVLTNVWTNTNNLINLNCEHKQNYNKKKKKNT